MGESKLKGVILSIIDRTDSAIIDAAGSENIISSIMLFGLLISTYENKSFPDSAIGVSRFKMNCFARGASIGLIAAVSHSITLIFKSSLNGFNSNTSAA